VARISMTPKRVIVQLDPITRIPCGFTVRPVLGANDAAVGRCEATIRGIYPYLYIGDPAFISCMFSDANLMARALRASAAPYFAGAFKMGSGEVGVSIRFGGRLALATYPDTFSSTEDCDRFTMKLEKVREDQDEGGETDGLAAASALG